MTIGYPDCTTNTVNNCSGTTAVRTITTPTLVETPATTRYSVQVTNACGIETSNEATITVLNPPAAPGTCGPDAKEMRFA